jgi:hypothetical protein
MKYSYDFFPDYPLPSALKLIMSAGDPLPEGDYALIDYYSPHADASHVITIQVVSGCQKVTKYVRPKTAPANDI